MATCIRCKGHVPGPEGETICSFCAGDIIDNHATEKEISALARVGMDALVDEATGYQQFRPTNDLQERYKKYYGKRLEIFKDIVKRLPEMKTVKWCPQHGYPVPCAKCGYK